MAKVFLLVFMFVLITGLKEGSPGESKIVFLRGNDIWIATGDGQNAKKLTTDSQRKYSPLWSPDGTKIAYLVPPTLSVQEKNANFAEVHIVDTQGNLLSSWSIPRRFPADGIVVNSFEDFQWIDNLRLGYIGNINPSLGEYRSVEAKTGKVLATYLGTQYQWSPDKKKIAYLGWNPHFYPEELICDYVEIDGKVRFASQESPIKYAIEGPLVWSPNSHYLAFVAKEKSTGKEILIVLNNDREIRREIPPALSGVERLLWDDEGRVLLLKADEVWVLNLSEGEIVRLEGSTQDDVSLRAKEAENRKREQTAIVQSLGGTSADWWPH